MTLTIPIRNREAQADQVRAELEYRQAQVRLQQLENQVRIEVRNAQFALQQNRASVQAAQALSTLPAKRWTPSSRNWQLESPTRQRSCRINLA